MATQLKTDLIASVNPSGFEPLDKRVLVLPDPVKEKEGSLFLPDSVKEQNKWAQVKGTLIAVGETAWSEAVDDARRHGATFTPPQPGARIMYGKYSGTSIKGDDGRDYQVMNDDRHPCPFDEGGLKWPRN
jgi:chaperonin GroES